MEKLVKALETSPSGKEKLLTVFWDKKCLPLGDDWELGFVNCLRNCGKIILFITPDSIKRCETADATNDNFLLEMDLATELYATKKVSVIPIFMVERTYPGGHEAFIEKLKTNFPAVAAKHRWSQKTIAATLLAVANLPDSIKMFLGDDFVPIAESISSQCPHSIIF